MTDEKVTITQELLLKLYSGVEVLISQQSEINRRLGVLEATLAEIASLEGRIEGLELWKATNTPAPFDWKSSLLNAVIWVVGVTLSVAVLGVLFPSLQAVF